MSVSVPNQTATILAEAKKDWRRNFAGAMIAKKPKFKTPTVRHYFSRQFDQLGRNMYFISIFGRILVKGDGVSEAEKTVYDRITTVAADVQKKVNAMKAIAAEAGIADFATYPLADLREITAMTIVPAQTKFLKVLESADEYLVMVNTLWIEGEIPDREKSKAEMEIKHNLGQIVSAVRRMRLFMQSKVRDYQKAVAETGSVESDTTAKELARAEEQAAAADEIRSEGADDVGGPDDTDEVVEPEPVAA